jgi:hypothetical protein
LPRFWSNAQAKQIRQTFIIVRNGPLIAAARLANDHSFLWVPRKPPTLTNDTAKQEQMLSNVIKRYANL